MTENNLENDYEPSADELEALPEHFHLSFAKATEEAERYRARLAEVEADIATEQTASRQLGEERIARLRRENDEHLLGLTRENVALRCGIPLEHSHRIVGKSREEMEADALDLADLLAG